MEIREPVKVRNPHGTEYWVERARLPELLRQGFEVVESQDNGESGAAGKRQRKRKVKDGQSDDG